MYVQYNQYCSRSSGMKNEQQAEAEAQLPEPIEKVLPDQPSQESQTAFLYEYLSLLQAEEKLKLSSLIDQLRAGGIGYNSEQDHNQFYLHLTHHSNNYRTLTLQVVLGPFTTVLNIFSETDPSFIHELNCLYGCFGNVYLLEWGAEEQVAIKCIQIKEEERAESTMLRTIKEYTINKIASALRVGPRVIKIQEFDLITYEKCIEFCMEKCCLAEQCTLTEQDHEMLKLSLKKLHALGIVHCDIKYSNIVYSRSYKSPVFLDFGFSKVLSTGPGVPTKTKYVGSLESCCKQMLQLYLNKDFGLVDLYYNDAYSLKTSLKADPIRETGNDLSEIVKSCDPPSLSFHFAKIYFYLYRDQTFHATNEFLKTRRSDKKKKIMGYLDTLPPTENLREFYFSFFQQQWRESIQFRDLVQLYGHSHRHHLQLGQRYPSDEPTTLPFYFGFMQKIFNCKLNLFQLDNDLINYSEICIGLSAFVSGKLSFEDETDFFIENAGLLVDNYFVRTRDFSLGWRICNIYFARIPEQKMGGAITESQRLYSCFMFLAEHCLEVPMTEWKYRVFRRAISQVMILKQTTVSAFQQYLSKVLSLICPLEKKLSLLHSLYKSLMYQTAVWGSLFSNCESNRLKLQQLGEKLQVQFYRLTTEDQYLQNLIKLDHFLLKNLLKPDNRVGEIQAIQISFVKLRKQHARQRQEFLRFIKIIYLFENEFNEQCRLQIQRSLSVSEKLIVLKPEYFILGMVYRRLRNTFRTKRIFTLIQSSAMAKDFIYDNPRMLSTFLEVEKVEANCLLDLKTVKPCMYLALVLKSYFQIKNGGRNESLESLEELIQEITQDSQLVSTLNKLSQDKCTISNKIEVYQRLIEFFSGKLSQCGSDLSQKIKDAYLDKLILEKYWLSGMYDQIIKHLTNKKTIKKQIRFESLEQDPTTFDFTLRAYLMLGRPEKVKSMIKSLEEQPYTQPRFIQRWILATSFCIFFQYLLEKNIWQDFRDFLLALVDFMDIHPVNAFINSYTQSIRYSFSQKVDLTLMDSGLQTIIFPKYQWKYPLLSFFHIEALSAMAKISDYLNRKELQLYLWRLTPFLPYLTSSQLKWFLQEYYHLLLKLSPKERCCRAILLKCRSLISYKFSHHHFNYNLVHIQLLENDNLMQMILRKAMTLDGFIAEQPTPILSNFKQKTVFSTSCMAKLRRYHRVAGNESMKDILNNSEVLLRLRLDR